MEMPLQKGWIGRVEIGSPTVSVLGLGQVEGNEGEHLDATLLHHLALFLERLVDLVIDPPAG